MILKKPMSNLLLRIITGVVIAFLTLIITYFGGLSFKIFSLVIGAAIIYEWQTITSRQQSFSLRIYSWIFYSLLTISLLLNASLVYMLALLAVGCFLLFILSLVERHIKTALLQSVGLCYAALFPICFVVLRQGLSYTPQVGLYWTLFLFIVVWGSDIGAYICGRLIGGAKLAPRISPNKTWSGAVGGTVIAVLSSTYFSYMMWINNLVRNGADFKDVFLNLLFIMLISFILSIVSQIGDLAESFLKRRFDVKDSSNLLPGHGGIMDRVDGLLPAGVVFTMILIATGWAMP